MLSCVLPLSITELEITSKQLSGRGQNIQNASLWATKDRDKDGRREWVVVVVVFSLVLLALALTTEMIFHMNLFLDKTSIERRLSALCCSTATL